MKSTAFENSIKYLQEIASKAEPELPDDEEFERAVSTLYKRIRKRRRRKSGSERKQHDRDTLKVAAGIRALTRGEKVPYSFDSSERIQDLKFRSRKCYACNQPYRRLHHFYHMLCESCGDFSFARRDRQAELSGRTAMVTGGRIKIGFAVAVKLLRMGATVHVTTRYPRNAAVRFSNLKDFCDFSDRLTIHEVDFRAGKFICWLNRLRGELSSLNILINNAAQSVSRSDQYHLRLRSFENQARLKPEQLQLIADSNSHVRQTQPPGDVIQWADVDFDDDDRMDKREKNSWNMKLDDVLPGEMLEVLLVNANAPALLISVLRHMLCQSRWPDRYIVNVTGADGTFCLGKSGLHSHVNMSKAALNMLTRSCARDYLRDGVKIYSVDTGWITHEGSHTYRQKRLKEGFVPPYDFIDGAARILDPIIRGVERCGDIESGILLRNFEPSPW